MPLKVLSTLLHVLQWVGDGQTSLTLGFDIGLFMMLMMFASSTKQPEVLVGKSRWFHRTTVGGIGFGTET